MESDVRGVTSRTRAGCFPHGSGEGGGAGGIDVYFGGKCSPSLTITGLTSCYNIHTSRSREIDPKKQRPRRVINNKRCRRRVCVCGVRCERGGGGVWMVIPPSTPATRLVVAVASIRAPHALRCASAVIRSSAAGR